MNVQINRLFSLTLVIGSFLFLCNVQATRVPEKEKKNDNVVIDVGLGKGIPLGRLYQWMANTQSENKDLRDSAWVDLALVIKACSEDNLEDVSRLCKRSIVSKNIVVCRSAFDAINCLLKSYQEKDGVSKFASAYFRVLRGDNESKKMDACVHLIDFLIGVECELRGSSLRDGNATKGDGYWCCSCPCLRIKECYTCFVGCYRRNKRRIHSVLNYSRLCLGTLVTSIDFSCLGDSSCGNEYVTAAVGAYAISYTIDALEHLSVCEEGCLDIFPHVD